MKKIVTSLRSDGSTHWYVHLYDGWRVERFVKQTKGALAVLLCAAKGHSVVVFRGTGTALGGFCQTCGCSEEIARAKSAQIRKAQ